MEKQSYVSPRQLIALFIISRLTFEPEYYISLMAGRSIQDVLLAVPVNFILNYIVAIPILLLLKKYPGKDLIEIAFNIIGRAAGIIIAYFICFALFALLLYYLPYFMTIL